MSASTVATMDASSGTWRHVKWALMTKYPGAPLRIVTAPVPCRVCGEPARTVVDGSVGWIEHGDAAVTLHLGEVKDEGLHMRCREAWSKAPPVDMKSARDAATKARARRVRVWAGRLRQHGSGPDVTVDDVQAAYLAAFHGCSIEHAHVIRARSEADHVVNRFAARIIGIGDAVEVKP